jgi:nucleotide-binding universal stress UspA family protein
MRVLLATDGSVGSAVAERLVDSAPWPIGTSVEVVRVVEDRSGIPLVSSQDGAAGRAAVRDALDGVSAQAEGLRARGLHAEPVLLRGHAAERLVERIERGRPDLVVVGTRGIGRLGRVLLGSVSSAIVDHSPVPVLVARSERLGRIVLATDGSDVADTAISTVVATPVLAGARVRVVSVASGGGAHATPEELAGAPDGAVAGSADPDLDEHTEMARRAVERLAAVGLDAQPIVLSGQPGPAIRELARAWQADVIALGTHGRTGISRLVLGSVARDVLLHAGCSVLIVPRRPAGVRVDARATRVARATVALA